VKHAYDGEGLHVEFKPFVEPEQKLGTDCHKTKLREIVTTVVAFANTDGGHIYLGVNDDCSVMGIEQGLRAWAKTSINDATIKRYLGALKSKIKDIVHGEVTLCLSHARIDGVLVAIVEVPPAASKPVTIRQDDHLYMRTGSSNRKVPPDRWKSILDDKQARRLSLE
jgi:predicted HTH transcriptional regulator